MLPRFEVQTRSQKTLVIAIAVEDLLPTVAPARDMVNGARKLNS
jgi:hypothetical protein